MLDRSNATLVHITADDLQFALKQVRHAISQEETRYYLGGVFLHFDKGALHFVATNGHELARVSVKTEDDLSAMPAVILPRAFISDALKATSKRSHRFHDCPLVITPQWVALHPYQQETIEATPIDGTFPDYLTVIPRGFTREITANCEALLTAFKALAAFKHANKVTPCLKLTFESEWLKVSTQFDMNDAEGHAWANVKLTQPVKETFIIGFNGHYLVDILSTMKGNCTFKFEDPGSPTVLTDGSEGVDHVLMPMRV
jgi:DNA polymerase-3 subunit beta